MCLPLVVLFELSLPFLITIIVICRLLEHLLHAVIRLVGPRKETGSATLVRVHVDCDFLNGAGLATLLGWIKVHALFKSKFKYNQSHFKL